MLYFGHFLYSENLIHRLSEGEYGPMHGVLTNRVGFVETQLFKKINMKTLFKNTE